MLTALKKNPQKTASQDNTSGGNSSGWLSRLRSGLTNTRNRLAQVFSRAELDETLYERLEEALLLADAGTNATQSLLNALRLHTKQSGETSSQAALGFLRQHLESLLHPLEKPFVLERNGPTIVMVVGVNGAGKTTSIGKLAQHFTAQGKKVLLAAGDTFRAGAREQLALWAERTGAIFVAPPGADPAAVAFTAIQQGIIQACDVVLVDTAGRLSTQTHLMQEMQRIQRVMGKALPGAPHQTVLVVDGHTGQNALAQVRTFHDALQLSGLLLTKLDGTAKGGALVALAMENSPPAVYFLGLGEKAEDLQPFRAQDFAQAFLPGVE